MIAYDPENGTLCAAEDVIASLVSPATARPPRGLAEAGAARDRVLHPLLRASVETVRRPVFGTARVSYRGRSLDVWLGERLAVVLTPAGADGRRALVRVAPTSVPGALCRVVALGPTGRPASVVDVDALDGEEIARWWTLQRSAAAGSPGCLLEVVDTFGGLYVVDGDGTAHPSDPTEVFRLLVRAVGPASREAPLRPLPGVPGLPTAGRVA